MKNIVVAVILTVSMVVAGRLEAWNSTYSGYGKVLQTVGTITLILDSHGDIWELENNPLPDGAKVKIIFHDNCTPEYTYDDVVKKVTIVKTPYGVLTIYNI